MRNIIIAIDGYSGTGKSSTAKVVAKELEYTYIDSGAMYRAVTLYFLENNVSLVQSHWANEALEKINIDFQGGQVLLNGHDVSHDIRTMKVNQAVSKVSAIKEVREFLVAQQRRIGERKSIVMDGRDIGTVVFPDAELKVFMTANSRVRALRRQAELKEKGIEEELNIIEQNLVERDEQDTSRAESPLIRAEGCIDIDTSDLTFDEQVGKIVELANEKIHAS